jgi:isopenicillin N synthase-like dioxygenase
MLKTPLSLIQVDLMERWTNGKYKSTLHRVQPKIGQQERFSIALFMDPDSATTVEVIESCTSESNPAKYPLLPLENISK